MYARTTASGQPGFKAWDSASSAPRNLPEITTPDTELLTDPSWVFIGVVLKFPRGQGANRTILDEEAS